MTKGLILAIIKISVVDVLIITALQNQKGGDVKIKIKNRQSLFYKKQKQKIQTEKENRNEKNFVYFYRRICRSLC